MTLALNFTPVLNSTVADAGPTKAEEVAYWTAFVASLPRNSYLHSYFAGSVGVIENAISNDMFLDAVPALRKRQLEALKDAEEYEARLAKVRKQLAETETAVARNKVKLDRLVDDFKYVYSAAQTLLGNASKAAEAKKA